VISLSAARGLQAWWDKPLLACTGLLLLAGCATEPRADKVQVLPFRIFRVSGNARWKSDAGAAWQKAEAGTKLRPGAVVETGVNSRVDLRLVEGSRPTAPDKPGYVQIGPPNSLSMRFYTEPYVCIEPHSAIQRLRPCQVLTYDDRPQRDSIIRLWERTRLTFDQLSRHRSKARPRPREEVRLQLSAGHILGAVQKLNEDSSLRDPIWRLRCPHRRHRLRHIG
jgi:hypothetical protein